MKEKVNVAAVQTDITLFDVGANLAMIEKKVKEAKENGPVDLVVFPELASIGYIRERNKDFGCEYIKNAQKIPGEFTDSLGEIAKKNDVYIISGMTELHPQIPGTLYNTAVLVDPNGKIAGIHRRFRGMRSIILFPPTQTMCSKPI